MFICIDLTANCAAAPNDDMRSIYERAGALKRLVWFATSVHNHAYCGRPLCMKITYAPVSDPSQNLERQIAALRPEGCDELFSDIAPVKSSKGRLQFEKFIDAVGTDFVLVLAEWGRATRSVQDGFNIIQRLVDCGALIRVLDKPFLDLTTPMGRGILAFMPTWVEGERGRIVRRANDALALARKRGVRMTT